MGPGPPTGMTGACGQHGGSPRTDSQADAAGRGWTASGVGPGRRDQTSRWCVAHLEAEASARSRGWWRWSWETRAAEQTGFARHTRLLERAPAEAAPGAPQGSHGGHCHGGTRTSVSDTGMKLRSEDPRHQQGRPCPWAPRPACPPQPFLLRSPAEVNWPGLCRGASGDNQLMVLLTCPGCTLMRPGPHVRPLGPEGRQLQLPPTKALLRRSSLHLGGPWVWSKVKQDQPLVDKDQLYRGASPSFSGEFLAANCGCHQEPVKRQGLLSWSPAGPRTPNTCRVPG